MPTAARRKRAAARRSARNAGSKSPPAAAASPEKVPKAKAEDDDEDETPTNPYLDEFLAESVGWPEGTDQLFCRDMPLRERTKCYLAMATTGASLAFKYAWAVPDERVLHIMKAFAPLVELGAGTGYWANMMRARGATVAAFDIIGQGDEDDRVLTPNGKLSEHDECWKAVCKGGPEVLEIVGGRTNMMLCYPDDFEENLSLSMECLSRFQGEHILHVGELFGDTLSCDHSPWGRTTGLDFQVELHKQFQCICKVPLRYRWPHTRDFLTVYKRTTMAMILPAHEDSDRGRGRRVGANGRRASEGDDVRESRPRSRRSSDGSISGEDNGDDLIMAEYDSDDLKGNLSRVMGAREGDGGGAGDDDSDDGDGSSSAGSPGVEMWRSIPLKEQLLGEAGVVCEELRALVEEGKQLMLAEERRRGLGVARGDGSDSKVEPGAGAQKHEHKRSAEDPNGRIPTPIPNPNPEKPEAESPASPKRRRRRSG